MAYALKYIKFKDLDEVTQKRFVTEAKNIFSQNSFTVDDFLISHVLIGSADNPYSKICLQNGLTLFDESSSPEWAKEENSKILKGYQPTKEEAYKDYLGTGYHDKIRKLLTADRKLLPDSMIDADYNIGAMKLLISRAFNDKGLTVQDINNSHKYDTLTDIGLYYLCGVLCTALISRTKSSPFNMPKYKNGLGKKRDKYMERANEMMIGLVQLCR
jgi:hypothetical protein